MHFYLISSILRIFWGAEISAWYYQLLPDFQIFFKKIDFFQISIKRKLQANFWNYMKITKIDIFWSEISVRAEISVRNFCTSLNSPLKVAKNSQKWPNFASKFRAEISAWCQKFLHHLKVLKIFCYICRFQKILSISAKVI